MMRTARQKENGAGRECRRPQTKDGFQVRELVCWATLAGSRPGAAGRLAADPGDELETTGDGQLRFGEMRLAFAHDLG